MDIEQDEIDPERVRDSERRLAVRSLEDANALVFERDTHELHHMRLVVGDQY